MHYKVVLHTVIEGRRLTGTVKDACTRAEPSGRDANDRWPDDRSVGCYWPHHKAVFDAGIDGWWPDQGDGLDAPSRLARIRMYWEGSQVWRPNERPFALHRNGYAGMQRYGAFLWSGDVLYDVGDAANARAGRHQHRACREFPSGARTSAALSRPRSTRASCTYAGSNSARSARSSARTAETGTCGCRGDGTPASLDRWSFAATPMVPRIPTRASCTIRRSNPFAASTSSFGIECCRTSIRPCAQCCETGLPDDSSDVAASSR